MGKKFLEKEPSTLGLVKVYVSNLNLNGLCGEGIGGGKEGTQLDFHSIFQIKGKGKERVGFYWCPIIW